MRAHLLLVLVGVLAIAPSCQGDAQTPEPPPATESQAPAATVSSTPAPSPGKLIFSDDFSSPDSGWERQRDDDYITDYEAGEYQVKNATDHQVTKGIFEKREVSDGDFSVTARKISGPDDVRFGLFTRFTGTDFLEASILPDGRCNLWMAHYEGYVLKTKPNFQPCPAVKRGNEANQLRLVVSGAQATFYVNGQKVAELGQVSREGRKFGLFANSTASASDVRFDDFKLHEAQ